mmetsp:Transcript_78588/g.163294  ORF Transcript_78588/g.163294 Transcript_78588/m.163294 type:complete len:227 (+) Transcript_78588:96-776(+)
MCRLRLFPIPRQVLGHLRVGPSEVWQPMWVRPASRRSWQRHNECSKAATSQRQAPWEEVLATKGCHPMSIGLPVLGSFRAVAGSAAATGTMRHNLHPCRRHCPPRSRPLRRLSLLPVAWLPRFSDRREYLSAGLMLERRWKCRHPRPPTHFSGSDPVIPSRAHPSQSLARARCRYRGAGMASNQSPKPPLRRARHPPLLWVPEAPWQLSCCSKSQQPNWTQQPNRT